MRLTLNVFLMVLIALSASPLRGEIYQWVDEHGKTHFSDAAPIKNKAKAIRLKINSYTAPSISESNFRPVAKQKVVMYSASWCGACKKARAYFAKNNVPFTEYDVETSNKGKSDFKRMRGNGVPIILVGTKRLNGFSAASFRKLYSL